MKSKRIVSFLFFFLFSFSFMAGESRKIEQIIAKNIDGTISDFSFFYHNTTDSSLEIDVFITGDHRVSFYTEKNLFCSVWFFNPSMTYTIPPGHYLLNYDAFQELEIENEIIKHKNSVILSWQINYQRKEPAQIYLSGTVNSNMDFFHKKQKDGVFAEIIKLMDGNNLSFALLVANHTSQKIVFFDLYGDGNQVKLKFPNGRVFTHPLKNDAKSIELKPGESKTFKIELDQILNESKDFSMKDFEFGLTELLWEIKLDKEQTILRNFWLVKFNGELPIVIYDTGYKLDGPLTLETFRDKKISVLHNNEALDRDQENTKSETKETTGNKESSQK